MSTMMIFTVYPIEPLEKREFINRNTKRPFLTYRQTCFVQEQHDILTISSYSTFAMEPKQFYRIHDCRIGPYGINLERRHKILKPANDSYVLTQEETNMVERFENPEMRSISSGKCLDRGERLSLSSVRIKQVSNLNSIGAKQWKVAEVFSVEDENNITDVIFWNEQSNCLNTAISYCTTDYNISCLTVAEKDGIRCFYSTPLTKIELSGTEERLQGSIISANFELHLVEFKDDEDGHVGLFTFPDLNDYFESLVSPKWGYIFRRGDVILNFDEIENGKEEEDAEKDVNGEDETDITN